MPDFPDIHCAMKAIDPATGKAVPDGGFSTGGTVKLRFIVYNDSETPTSEFRLGGVVKQNGSFASPPFAPQDIQLAPRELRTFEHIVGGQGLNLWEGLLIADLVIFGDPSGQVVEELEGANNFAQIAVATWFGST